MGSDLTEAQVLDRVSDLDLLTLTALAEAVGDSQQGGSSVEERLAVMAVLRNRLRTPHRFGGSYRAVCLQNNGRTWQFDCWRPGSGPNHARLAALAYLRATLQPILHPFFEETYFLASGVASGVIHDRTNGATHYYAPASMVPKNSEPKWARDVVPCALVGGQRFYVNV